MHTEQRRRLDGNWRMWIADNERVDKECTEPIRAAMLEGCGYTELEARVPGNFELDMQRAGMIEEPFHGLNVLDMQDLENKHIWYATVFQFGGNEDEAWLLFEGIDTFADIYLNGTHIAATDNMLIPHEIKAVGIQQGDNELFVHIRPTAIEARKVPIDVACYAAKYNYASLCVRKAPHMYGWDIMPRILSGGIWRSVFLVQKPADRIDHVFIHTLQIDPSSGKALLNVFYQTTVSRDSLKDYSIRVSGSCKNSTFSVQSRLWHTCGQLNVTVENAQLWWPTGSGDSALYDVTVELLEKEQLMDITRLRTGIRTVALDRTSTTDSAGNGEFCFRVNGEKCFIKGTNWVPLDAFHSRDKERLPTALSLLKDIGCNMVRCWGGNVYEDDSFYDFCDENGILVWQDFAMACALYPRDEAFCDSLRREVEAVVKRLRNHPCIAVWAGDNENDLVYTDWAGVRRNPQENVLTRSVIPEILRRMDYTRPYLPSSPYIDDSAYENGSAALPEDHLWGPRDNYKSKFYSTSTAHFASEMGYHGCPSPSSIQRFISPGKLWPWKDNDEWIAHASSPEISQDGPYRYRIELMANQIYEFFGHIPDNLETFSMASQISQAEAFKFFIEFFRTQKWRRTGIIWWNLLDGWPQFSDAVVDYYFTKKLAYHFIKQSSQPICLMFAEAENWIQNLMAVNDTSEAINIHYTVKDLLANGALICEADATVNANSIERIHSVRYSISERHFYLIEWQYAGMSGKNHYLAGNPPFDMDEYLACLKHAGLYLFEGFSTAK